MAEQSYLFDFNRTEDFFENFNKRFEIDDMYIVTGYNDATGEYSYKSGSGGSNFALKMVSYGGDNISEYLDSSSAYSKLKSTVDAVSQSCGLDWYNRGDGECTIELHDTVTFTIGDDNVPLKAVFLCCDDYVMGYSINMNNHISITNELVFDDDVIFWDISRLK